MNSSPAVPHGRDLASRGSKCTNLWIYLMLWTYPSNEHGRSHLQRWSWGAFPQKPWLGIALFGPRAFTSRMIFTILTWWPSSNFCTRQWVGPRKSSSNRTPHVICPALSAPNLLALVRYISSTNSHKLFCLIPTQQLVSFSKHSQRNHEYDDTIVSMQLN